MTTTIFDPKIVISTGVAASDSWDDSLGLFPPNNFVVTRNSHGMPASHFGDLAWDFSAYNSEGRTHWLYFAFWKEREISPTRTELAREMRELMFVLIYKRPGEISVGTLAEYLASIRDLGKFADRNAYTIRDVLDDPVRLIAFVEECNGNTATNLNVLFSTLLHLGAEQSGFRICGVTTLDEFESRARTYRISLKQHALIPTRIYSEIISRLKIELDDFEAIGDLYLALVAKCFRDRLYKRQTPNLTETVGGPGLTVRSKEYRPEFNSLLSECGLVDYFSTKGLSFSLEGLSTGLAIVQMAAKFQIHAFSGMRHKECRSLPYHCLDTSVSNGKAHHLILGNTTKLNKGNVKRVRWVTSREGHRAIRIAQKIADAIYGALGDRPKNENSRRHQYSLFVSPSYLQFVPASLTVKGGRYLANSFQFSTETFTKLRARLQPDIKEVDLRELERIDPHRAWRTEDPFQVGKPWTLTTHQLRRSLAVYAQRSGLVSLASLRQQLQHITDEMSRYYARGSAYAKNIIGNDKKHFGFEWQDTQPTSSALSYMLNVFLSEEDIFGGHSNWVHHRLRDESGIVAFDREQTIRRFKKGEQAYRETVLGGCVKVGECDEIPLKWLDIGCLSRGCANLVWKVSKLDRVIAALTRHVGSLKPGSQEFLNEKGELDILISAREKAIQQQSSQEAA